MKKAVAVFVLICGVAGILDVLFFEGKIGVWLSQFLSLRFLFVK